MNFYFLFFIFFMEQVRGEITYNGCRLNEFVPKKTSAYISQNDVHVGEMTVKETLDFSARCQGVGTRYGKKNDSFRLPVLLTSPLVCEARVYSHTRPHISNGAFQKHSHVLVLT
jgi:ABC-type sugar transport system ATPase subunit